MAKKFKTPTSEEMPESGRNRRARGVHFTDVGATGLRHTGGFVREEFLLELQGPNGMRVIREMVDNDPVVGGFLFAIEQACRQVDWKLIPADDSDEARKYANFVDSCRMDMSHTWGDMLTEALSFLPFGWSLLEVLYKVRRGYDPDPAKNSRYKDGLVGWQKMSLRSQESMRRWMYDPSNKDKLLAMEQFTFEKGMVQIPISRCLHFRTKSFKDNPQGRSLLRNAYRPWYLKKRIEEVEGVGIERDMAGLPVLTAPEGMDLWNENDPAAVEARKAAENIVRNIRVDEQMGVLLPFGWDLKLLAAGGKRMINTTMIIDRYDQRIAMTVLADFMLLGHTNRLGSFALAKSKTGLFAMSLVGYLNVLRDQFNSTELPRLWRLNGFPEEAMPRLDYTPVDTPALKDLASYITSLAGAGVDMTAPELQRYLLQSAGVPSDLTDLAGRGGTGTDANGDGVIDEADQNVNPGGAGARPSMGARPAGGAGSPAAPGANRGVYTGRRAAQRPPAPAGKRPAAAAA